MTENDRPLGKFLPLMWFSHIKLARNAAFSITQIVVITIAVFWMYRRSALLVGLTGLGAWSVTMGLVSLLIVADFGITEAMVREIARFRVRQDWSGMRRAIVSCVCYVAPVILVMGSLLFPLVRSILRGLIPHDPHLMANILIINGVVIVALNAVSVGLLGAIEGFERYDLRLVVSLSASGALVISSFFLLVRFGAVGISLSFLIQSVVSVAVSAFILMRLIPPDGASEPRLSLRELRRLSKIGVPLRLGTLVNLTYEPVTRLLVAKFGGIESAGLYEAAVRCGSQGKAMIVACIQVVSPRLSALAVDRAESLKKLLRVAYEITGLLVVGALPVILLAVPLISLVLLGRVNVHFEMFASILSIGWLVNALAAPPSFANLADGRLFWNWLSNVCAAVINPIIGLALGPMLGALGVVIGTACALISMAGIAIVARAVNSRERVPLPGRSGAFLLVFATLVLLLREILRIHFHDEPVTLIVSLALTTIYALVWLVVAMRSLTRIISESQSS
jgi:O-antigen/teichoic acid export membrane protein